MYNVQRTTKNSLFLLSLHCYDCLESCAGQRSLIVTHATTAPSHCSPGFLHRRTSSTLAQFLRSPCASLGRIGPVSNRQGRRPHPTPCPRSSRHYTTPRAGSSQGETTPSACALRCRPVHTSPYRSRGKVTGTAGSPPSLRTKGLSTSR